MHEFTHPKDRPPYKPLLPPLPSLQSFLEAYDLDCELPDLPLGYRILYHLHRFDSKFFNELIELIESEKFIQNYFLPIIQLELLLAIDATTDRGQELADALTELGKQVDTPIYSEKKKLITTANSNLNDFYNSVHKALNLLGVEIPEK